MSHYPPDAQFLDLCDEMGLYVLDELAGWHHFYDNEVGPKLVQEMVVRDVNHPCILFWDNGNEGGFNTNLDHLFDEYDPQQRRVLHPWTAFSGLNTAHYLAYDKAEIAAGGQRVYYAHNQELVATNDPAKYIYMPTEFLHGLYDGGAGAGLDDYWRMMMSHPACAGGFIWALLDDGLKRPDTGQIDVVGNEAPGWHRRALSPARGQLLRHQGNLVAHSSRPRNRTACSRWKIISISPMRATANSPGNCGISRPRS